MEMVKIIDLSNNRFNIQDEIIYAPNMNVALERYIEKYPNDIVFVDYMNSREKMCKGHFSKVSHTKKLLPIHNPRVRNMIDE